MLCSIRTFVVQVIRFILFFFMFFKLCAPNGLLFVDLFGLAETGGEKERDTCSAGERNGN